MTTPMISNLKKLQDQVTGSDPKDLTLYRQIIGSLMYLVHTRPDICYAVNALNQFMCEPKHIHLVVVKHILRYVRGSQIHFQWRCNASWIYRFRLDGQYSGSEEHFQILLQFGFSDDFLVQQEIGLHSPKHCRSRIHCCKCC
jgi:hypothetical protein